MASRKDVLLIQVVSAFAQGCGRAEIQDDAADWFHERYYPWITAAKTNAQAGGRRPLDVWDSVGKDFLDKFREIGQKAAAAGIPIGAQALAASAVEVEKGSDCPWCPIQD